LRREIDLLRTIYNHFSTRKEAPYEVAEAYYTLCDIKNAIDFYQKALDLDENFARAHNHLAYCYSHRGEHDKALLHFKKYVQLDSTANAFDSLADGYMAAGLLDSAAWAKEQGIKLDPELNYLYGGLCYVQIRQGKLVDAEKSVENYLAFSPEPQNQANGYFRLALIENFRKSNEAALSHAQKGLQLFDSNDLVTRNHGLHWLLGLLYLEAGQPAKAEEELAQMEMLIDQHHISATNYRMGIYKYARHLRACLAAQGGDLNQLFEIIQEFDGPIKDKIKDHGSPFGPAFFYTDFGEILQRSDFNQTSRAQSQLEKALVYNSNYAMAHYNLWQLFRANGDDDKSQKALTSIQTIWSDADPDVRALYGIPQ